MSWGNIWGSRHEWVEVRGRGYWLSVMSYLSARTKRLTVCLLQRIYSPLVSGRFEELIQNHQGQGSKQGSISVTSKQPLSHLCIQKYRFLKWIDPLYNLKLKYSSVTCDMMTSDQQGTCSCVGIPCILCICHTACVWDASGQVLQQEIYIWLWKEQSRRLKACPVAGPAIVFE